MTDTSETSRAKWPWAILCIALLAVAGGVHWWASQPEDRASAQSAPPPLVRVVSVEPADIATIRQTGFVRAMDQIDVVPQISERITQIGESFHVGTRVAEGHLLIGLDPTSFEAEVTQAEANVDQATAAVEESRITLARQRELAQSDFASEATLDDAQVALLRSQADLALARAQLQRAQLALDDTSLRAPFDAIVTEQAASIGQFVQAGTPVGHIVRTQAVEIRMGLLPSDLMLLGGAEAAIGLPVTVTDPTTERDLGTGTVTGVVPAIETQTRTVNLLVRLADPFMGNGTGTLRVDELVQMSLDVPLEGTAFHLPAEALKGDATLWRVADGQLQRLEVNVLSRTGATVIIRHPDLAQGDTILLSDLVAPTEGDAVRVEDDMQFAQGG